MFQANKIGLFTSFVINEEDGLFMEKCLVCNRDMRCLNNYRKDRKFCHPNCSSEFKRKRYLELNPAYRGLESGTMGTISELRVCVELLSRGYHVYRAVAPNALCDLAILKDGKLLRVEVTTGHIEFSGKVGYPPKDKTRFDLLAITLPEKIIFIPDKF